MSGLHRGVHLRLSQQADGAPKGRPDNQDRVGRDLVEEQSGGGGQQLGQNPLSGLYEPLVRIQIPFFRASRSTVAFIFLTKMWHFNRGECSYTIFCVFLVLRRTIRGANGFTEDPPGWSPCSI